MIAVQRSTEYFLLSSSLLIDDPVPLVNDLTLSVFINEWFYDDGHKITIQNTAN